MARSSNYRVQLRRRREGKTDYQARKALVISGKPRLVARVSIKNIQAQIVAAKPHGDVVLVSANSHELIKKHGWKAPTGNIPAAYLTGLLCGLKAKAAGINETILDIGLVSPTKGSKVFAVLGGVVDGGIDVPFSEDKIVKERLKGEHIAKYAKNLGVGSEEYAANFGKYISSGVAPEKMVEHVSKVKAELVASFKGAKVVEEEPTPKPPVKEKPAKAKVTTKPAASKEKAKAPKEKKPEEKTAKKGGKKE